MGILPLFPYIRKGGLVALATNLPLRLAGASHTGITDNDCDLQSITLT
jgi:hypothetical protein